MTTTQNGGTCYACGAPLARSADGTTLTCTACGLTLQVTKPAQVTATTNEVADAAVCALAEKLAQTPSAPISAADMRTLTLANAATQAAILPQVILLAEDAMARRKFRRAIPLYTIANSVAPSAAFAVQLMLAKAGCGNVTEIPDSDVELTTMAEYPVFLKLADAETRADFLKYVREQAERKEEEEEARQEEERLAYIATEHARLRILIPCAYVCLALTVLLFAALATLASLGIAFSLGRIAFWLQLGSAVLTIAAFLAVSILAARINRADDADTDNRSVVLVIVLCLVLAICSALVLSVSGIGGGYDGRTDGFYYMETEDGLTLSAPNRTEDILEIPASLHGAPVIALDDFSGGTFYALTIPNTVTTIHPFAFANCKNLADVLLPARLSTLGEGAFSRNTALSAIRIPDNITTIGGHTFSGCTSLTTVHLPETLTRIDGNAFENCTSLVEITLPETVDTIARETFRGCTALRTIHGGSGVITVGAEAFADCTALHTLAFGDELVSIGAYAFRSCSALVRITLPASLKTVGKGAFAYCINLERVTIPTGSATFDKEVFVGCDKLVLDIPETPASQFTVTEATDGMVITQYNGTDSIVSIPSYINDKPVIHIGESAFKDNKTITNITLPNTLMFIGTSAFSGCEKLVNVSFGKNLAEIGRSAFAGCTSLSVLDLSACTSLSTIREFAFQSCLELSEVTFNDTLVTIGRSAFIYCKKIESVTLPNSLAQLMHSAFQDCVMLRTVTFGTGALQIYPDLFYGCGRLKSVTLPSNVTIEVENRPSDDVLVSPFHGWTAEQTVNILRTRPADFLGFGECEANIRWLAVTN